MPYEYSHVINLVVHIWLFHHMSPFQAGLHSLLPNQNNSGQLCSASFKPDSCKMP